MSDDTSDSLGLIVPMRVDAMPIGGADQVQQGSRFADFYALYQGQKTGTNQPAYVGEAFTQNPTDSAPAPKGVHLHWVLPRALRRGAAQTKGGLNMPEVPNRWLVTRFVGGGTPSDYQSWVIESDYQSNEPITQAVSNLQLSPSQPGEPSGTLAYFTGRAVKLEDWSEGNKEDYLTTLSAIGYGAPSFSGYLPNCYNMFGMLDEEAPDGTLGYSVIGWYSESSRDPLSSIKLDGKKNPFGWLFDGDQTPDHTLLAGAIFDIGYQSDGTVSPLGDDPSLSCNVGIGNSQTDTLSALIDKLYGASFQGNVEQLLNALQESLLETMGSPGWSQRVTEAVQGSAFAHHQGGPLWEIVRLDKDGKITLTDGDVPPELLALLDQAQLELNQEQNNLISFKRQWFMDWCRFQTLERWQNGDPPVSPDDLLSNIIANPSVSEADKQNGSIQDLQKAVDKVKGDINSLLSTQDLIDKATYELKQIQGPRYYGPKDPFILFEGADDLALPRDLMEDDIQCFTTDSLPATISLRAGLVTGSTALSITTDALPVITDASSLPYSEIAGLVSLNFAFDPANTAFVVAAFAALGGDTNPAQLDSAATQKAINDTQVGLSIGAPVDLGVGFSMVPEAEIGLRNFGHIPDFSPIALIWDGTYTSVARTADGSYPTDHVLKYYDWNDSRTDLIADADTNFDSSVKAISGWVPLNASITVNLRKQLAKYAELTSNTEVQELVGDIAQQPLLAQSLSGFGATMIQNSSVMQMPLADPFNPGIQSVVNLLNESQYIGDQTRLSALPQYTFDPIRACQVTIQDMILVDQFGRRKRVVPTETAIASDFETMKVANPWAFQPPLRVMQRSRIWFRWLAACLPDMDSSSLPGADPICGWLVPNFLTEGLMAFDASGKPIGMLMAAGGDAIWYSAPGVGQPDDPLETSLQGANETLAALLIFAQNQGADYVRAMVATIRESQKGMAPGGAPANAVAMLLGAPVALVQAEIDLQLEGTAVNDQGFDALDVTVKAGDPMVRSTAGFENVSFPLWLGDPMSLADGLVGYFLPRSGNVPDLTTFYSEFAEGADTAITEAELTTLTATFADAPKTVTMLLDPRGSVSVASGINPTKKLTIPPNQYEPALANMTFAFPVFPIVSGGAPFSMPVPDAGAATWTWYAAVNTSWQADAPGKVNPATALQPATGIVDGWLSEKPANG